MVENSLRDYSQPNFYRFSEDSCILAHKVAKEIEQGTGIDLCAGCGVIGIEATLENPKLLIDFNELQPSFHPFLKENIKLFLPGYRGEVFKGLNSKRTLSPKKYDFIICNPPYFSMKNNRSSPCLERSMSRLWHYEDFNILLYTAHFISKKNGVFFLLVKKSDEVIKILKTQRLYEFSETPLFKDISILRGLRIDIKLF